MFASFLADPLPSAPRRLQSRGQPFDVNPHAIPDGHGCKGEEFAARSPDASGPRGRLMGVCACM